MTHHLTEILALLMVIGIAAQWIGWRLQIPSIILLSLSGLLIGPVFGVFRPSEALGDACASRLDCTTRRRGGLIIVGTTAWSNGLAKALHEREVPVIVVDNAWHRLRGARLAGVTVILAKCSRGMLNTHSSSALMRTCSRRATMTPTMR